MSYVYRGGYQSGLDGNPALAVDSSQLVTQSLPPYTELSRQGFGWQGMSTSAIAALVVRPSTTAAFTLFNNSSASSPRVYVIDRVGAFNLVTTDAVESWSIWGCVHPSIAVGTADITAIKSYSGVSSYAGAARLDNGATVTDDGWFIMSTNGVVGNSSTTTPGNALVHETGGRFIVPQGGAFSLHVVASVVGATFTHLIGWYEIPTSQLSVQ
jgi:hypothetical protein